MNDETLVLGGVEILPGTRHTVRVPVARRYTAGEVSLPVAIVRGKRPGPVLFVSAAIHGDEINGVEVIRRLLHQRILNRVHGTLIAVPVVNVYGFIAQTRYMPDRRDLNRSFPGSPRGSLASRLAHTFLTEIVSKADYGIDLHTGALHRSNLPQVRATLGSPGSDLLAFAFGAPVIIDADLRPGSLRAAVEALEIPVITYEAGEALRFDELAIRAGLRGILSVMRKLDMLPPSKKSARIAEPFVAHGSTWVRASESGIVSTRLKLGARISKDQVLATISDPLGDEEVPILSPTDGVLIGRATLPLANEGDALFHVAVFERLGSVADEVDQFQEDFFPNLNT